MKKNFVLSISKNHENLKKTAFNNSNDNTKLNAKKLRFFDSMYDNKSINIDQIIKHAEKNI